jgi:hypothetical protein
MMPVKVGIMISPVLVIREYLRGGYGFTNDYTIFVSCVGHKDTRIEDGSDTFDGMREVGTM